MLLIHVHTPNLICSFKLILYIWGSFFTVQTKMDFFYILGCLESDIEKEEEDSFYFHCLVRENCERKIKQNTKNG